MKLYLKKWKERRRKCKELIEKSNEMLTYIANFFTKEYIAIVENILNKHSEVQGFSPRSQTGEFIFNEKFLFIIDAGFDMKLVNIDTTVFNEIVFNAKYDNDLYKVVMKINPEAEELVNEIEEAIKEFNKKNGFEFFEVLTNIHSISNCGIFLSASLSNLEEYFERHEQYGHQIKREKQIKNSQ